MESTLYVLLRDGAFYMWSYDRAHIAGIVASNPDFTARNPDGSEPRAMLLEYSLKDVINI